MRKDAPSRSLVKVGPAHHSKRMSPEEFDKADAQHIASIVATAERIAE
jgi:hypothetical protein